MYVKHFHMNWHMIRRICEEYFEIDISYDMIHIVYVVRSKFSTVSVTKSYIWRPVEPGVMHGSPWSLNSISKKIYIIRIIIVLISYFPNSSKVKYLLWKVFIKVSIFCGKYGKQEGFGSIGSINPWWLSPSGVTIDWIRVQNRFYQKYEFYR